MKVLGLALILSACHQQRELPRLEDDPRTVSIVMLALGDDGLQWATAFDVERGYPLISYRGDVELVALNFGCPLERLGLGQGRQPLLAQPTADVRLPPPRRIFSLPVDMPAWAETSMSERIDAALRAIDLPEDNRCLAYRAVFEPRDLIVENDDGQLDPTFVLPWDSNTTLVGAVPGHVYRVTREGEVDRVETLGEDRYLGAWKSPTGELWMMTATGTLARGSLDKLTIVSSTSAFGLGADRIALAGPREPGAPFELFVSARIEDESRVFIRFDGTRWERISRADELTDIFYPATVWIEPGHAIAIGSGLAANHVVRYHNGVISSEPIPSDGGHASMIQHPTLGTLVGGDDGSIARYSTDWLPLVGGPVTRYVRTLVPLDDGFIFGSSTERNFHSYYFRQYFPATGYCGAEELTSNNAVAVIYLGRLGDDALLGATLDFFDRPFNLVILEQVEPAGICSRD